MKTAVQQLDAVTAMFERQLALLARIDRMIAQIDHRRDHWRSYQCLAPAQRKAGA
jgi:hypothetical protein